MQEDSTQIQQPQPVVSIPTPLSAPETAQSGMPQEIQPKKGNSLVYFAVLLVVLLVVGAAFFVILGKNKTNYSNKSATLNTNTKNIASPSATPITANNVDQTLDNTNSSVQQSIDQANNDLNQINSIDKSLDNTN